MRRIELVFGEERISVGCCSTHRGREFSVREASGTVRLWIERELVSAGACQTILAFVIRLAGWAFHFAFPYAGFCTKAKVAALTRGFCKSTFCRRNSIHDCSVDHWVVGVGRTKITVGVPSDHSQSIRRSVKAVLCVGGN